jgi:hypothetical protein
LRERERERAGHKEKRGENKLREKRGKRESWEGRGKRIVEAIVFSKNREAL